MLFRKLSCRVLGTVSNVWNAYLLTCGLTGGFGTAFYQPGHWMPVEMPLDASLAPEVLDP